VDLFHNIPEPIRGRLAHFPICFPIACNLNSVVAFIVVATAQLVSHKESDIAVNQRRTEKLLTCTFGIYQFGIFEAIW